LQLQKTKSIIIPTIGEQIEDKDERTPALTRHQVEAGMKR